MTRARATLDLSEQQWQALLLEHAELYGWWTYHPHDSRRSTPGWPDLTLIRAPEILFVELKTEAGVVTAEQRLVLDALTACGLEAHVWRPSNETEAFARLAARRPRSTR